MPPQEIPAEVKSCKAITDDKDRLKCFDSLFAEPSKRKILRKERKPIGQSVKPSHLLMVAPR